MVCTSRLSAVAAPAPAAAPPPAELEEVDVAMQQLAAKKAAWAAAPLEERISVLQEIRARLLDQLLPWSRATAGIRCSTRDGQVASDVMLTVLCVAGQLDGYIRSLEHLKKYGCMPRPPSTTRDGQSIVDAFPQGFKESKLSLLGLGGATVKLYLQPGKPETQGHFYREPHSGKLAVVLGAGNQHHLALSDALHMAIPAAPFIDYVLEPLARRGYFASSTNPSLEVTQRMLYSPLTDCVHMTGGTATHDAIVWGSDPAEQARRRADNDPLLKVPISSELGCVTPWLVVPGEWSEKELTHQSRALAEALASNCSCNCLAPKVILMAEGWAQADQFVAAVKAELGQLPLPAPYYPGIRQRYQAFKDAYPQASSLEKWATRAACGEPLPYLVNELPAYPADAKSEYAFRMAVDGEGSLVEAFLEQAVRAANEDLWGSLSCSLLVDPTTEAAHGAAVQRALDGLRYGSVSVNAWSAMGFLPAASHWGAFGGEQTIADIGSGLGAIHNCYMFDHTQKAVVRTPFLSAAHPLPAQYAPLPLGVAKVIAGLTHSGVWGALKMVFAR
ncbi:hypothetical protein CHLNCDRAFT_140596 [Chlorella variabilis]|uniref:Aldehyde dehydrogenase domain-containing protein n=1 Tax=Chlorella variabilis TaxID=554065 RepID=E1Z5R8_CHLVA|nr:hypothetical protein CHLNCDRAFT_140596 [Chlorella variabilis]EFN58802.1 hypothetical protein CHLNCDRAFT_140596 [Chlorella variabilis]|eukprot:XP_005850904.1 hypothetical protein CHLNCDRAFT_140596 [Chlorella variabilis]